jgi:very-short-patch-repair endonuclease
MRRGLRVTSALRTVCDLGSRRDLAESVIAIDIATHVGLIDLPALVDFVESHPGRKGIKRLRRAIGFAEPAAESPMETRLRLAIVRARLPLPRAQVELHDRAGRFIARVDLYYPDRRLVIEYDGEGHKDRLVPDMRRQNALVNAGYHILRFTAPDLRVQASVVAQIRRARALLPRHAG